MFSYITDTFRALFKYARAAASPVFDVKNDTAVEYKEYTYNADTRLPVTFVDSFVFKVDNLYGIASSNYLLSERFDFNAIIPEKVESSLIMMNHIAPSAQADVIKLLGSNDIYIVPGINCNPREKMRKFAIFYLVCDKAFRMPNLSHYLVLLADFKVPKILTVTKDMEVKWDGLDSHEDDEVYYFNRIIRDVADNHRVKVKYIRVDKIGNPHVVWLTI